MIRFGPFEAELEKMGHKIKNLRDATKLMRKSLSHWLGPEGLLNKKQADHLALDIKMALWEQDFPGADVSLHPFTLYMRERMGISSKKVGVGSGLMMKAIQSIPEGGGKYSVGISSGASNTGGNEGEIGSIRETSWRFEVGYRAKRISPSRSLSKEKGSVVSKPVHEQPARPFFFPTVMDFIEEEKIEHNAKATIYDAWMRGARRWQRFGGDQYGGGLTVSDFSHKASRIQGDL